MLRFGSSLHCPKRKWYSKLSFRVIRRQQTFPNKDSKLFFSRVLLWCLLLDAITHAVASIDLVTHCFCFKVAPSFKRTRSCSRRSCSRRSCSRRSCSRRSCSRICTRTPLGGSLYPLLLLQLLLLQLLLLQLRVLLKLGATLKQKQSVT